MSASEAWNAVSLRVRRQQLFFRVAVFGFIGFIVIAVGGCTVVLGLNIALTEPIFILLGVITAAFILAAIVGCAAYIIAGIAVHAAVARLVQFDPEEMPIMPGEHLGNMIVLESGAKLHLSREGSTLRAGSRQLTICIVFFAIGLLWVYAGILGKLNALGMGILALLASFIAATVPFAMQWVAGELPSGKRGILIERVRFFFLRDAYEIPADQIAALVATKASILMKNKQGRVVLLLSSSTLSTLTRWNHARVAQAIEDAVGVDIPTVNR